MGPAGTPPVRWSRNPAALGGALAVILVADEALARLRLPWLIGGLLDEPAHLATALIVFGNLPDSSPAWTAAFAVGSVAVDADHVPLIPRRHEIRLDDPRPAAHTLLAPAAAAAAGCLARARARETLLGLAAGIGAHFARDVGTGTGLRPVYPLKPWRVRLPRRLYEAAMAALAVRAAMLERAGSSSTNRSAWR